MRKERKGAKCQLGSCQDGAAAATTIKKEANKGFLNKISFSVLSQTEVGFNTYRLFPEEMLDSLEKLS